MAVRDQPAGRLFAISLPAETAAMLDDAETSRLLYRLLLPWTHLNVVDQAEFEAARDLCRALGIASPRA